VRAGGNDNNNGGFLPPRPRLSGGGDDDNNNSGTGNKGAGAWQGPSRAAIIGGVVMSVAFLGLPISPSTATERSAPSRPGHEGRVALARMLPLQHTAAVSNLMEGVTSTATTATSKASSARSSMCLNNTAPAANQRNRRASTGADLMYGQVRVRGGCQGGSAGKERSQHSRRAAGITSRDSLVAEFSLLTVTCAYACRLTCQLRSAGCC
jgi:hypothetical protein